MKQSSQLANKKSIFRQNAPQLISGKERLIIEALDGQAYIWEAKNTFQAGIDPDFKSWGLNRPGLPTQQTLVDIREAINDGTLLELFTDIISDLDKIVMTQAQIIHFCEKYPDWLFKGNCPTFFLMNANSNYFVVCVNRSTSGNLNVTIHRAEIGHIWARNSFRIVHPRLDSTKG